MFNVLLNQFLRDGSAGSFRIASCTHVLPLAPCPLPRRGDKSTYLNGPKGHKINPSGNI